MDQSLRSTETAAELTVGALTPDYEVSLVSLNQWQIAWRRFLRHKLAVFGGVLFLAICVIAVIGPMIIPYNFYYIPTPAKFCTGTQVNAAFGCAPSLNHIMGTTGGLNRDVLALLLSAARRSLT